MSECPHCNVLRPINSHQMDTGALPIELVVELGYCPVLSELRNRKSASMIASLRHMKAHYKPGVFAYSEITGEEYSANPADYFMCPDDWVLEDTEDFPMVLAIKTVSYLSPDGEEIDWIEIRA